MKTYDPLLALGAHLRLTRLLTVDVMGGYMVTDPLVRLREQVHRSTCVPERLMTERLPEVDDTFSAEHRYGWYHSKRCLALSLVLEGLDCPHCCGLWVATGVVLMYVISSRSPTARAAWRAVSATLSLGYVGGHVCSRVDLSPETG